MTPFPVSPPLPRTPSGSRPEAAPNPPTILVVDDYPENCRLLYFYLRGEYRVLTAFSAEHALDILEEEHVDLVVMDINLKDGMNGIEATERIRERPGLERLPVLAISAYAYPDDRARFLAAGFDDYIPKPIFKDRMLRKVRALLTPRAEASPSRTARLA
jgi:CheY-like chemotaxis protein